MVSEILIILLSLEFFVESAAPALSEAEVGPFGQDRKQRVTNV